MTMPTLHISRLQRMTLSLTILAVATLGTVAFLVLPTMRDIDRFRNDLRAEYQTLEEHYAQGHRINRLHDDWVFAEPTVERIHAATVARSESIAFITRLEGIAEAEQLDHRLSIPPEKIEGAKSPTITVPYAIEWQGSWEHILRALVTLEREPFYLPISTITIRSNRRGAFATPTGRGLRQPTTTAPAANLLSPITVQITGSTIWKRD